MSLGSEQQRLNNPRRFTSLVRSTRLETAILLVGAITCWLCLETGLAFLTYDLTSGMDRSWSIGAAEIIGSALATMSLAVPVVLRLRHAWHFAAYVLIAVGAVLAAPWIIGSLDYAQQQGISERAVLFLASPVSLIAVAAVFAGNWRESLGDSIRLQMPKRPVISFASPLLIWLGFTITLAFIATTFDLENRTQHRSQMYFDDLGDNVVIALAVMAILVPVAEEIFFRGLLMTLLAKLSNGMGAILLSALGFAALHYDPLFSTGLSHAYIFGMGILLAASTVATRSIWPSVLVHSVNNSGVVYAVANS